MSDEGTYGEGKADPRIVAAFDLLGRTGAHSTQLRYSDDETPTVWMAVAEYKRRTGSVYEAASSVDAVQAVLRLCAQLLNGGQCVHCKRTTVFERSSGVIGNPSGVCWYRWHEATQRYRRSCE
jgi:hypothetical protein